MRTWFRLTSAALIAGALFAGSSGADAQSIMKQCGEQWQAAKQAGTTNGETWPQFLKECRARLGSATSTPPSGGFAPAAPPPAPAPAPAPTPANYGNAAPAGAGQFASEQEARYRCPVVWVNERSHIYHFPGTSYFGHTKIGAFMCEADAKAAGDRAAMNEHHP
jgi:hypothetical protein